MNDKKNRLIILILLALALGLAACATSPPKQTGLLAQTDEVEISNRELHMMLYGYSYVFSGTVEVAADSILARSTDPEIRKRAILWKLNTVPIVQGMSFEPDPLYAFFGIWAFMVQMRQYFETGVGRNDFGEWQHVAIGAARKMEILASDIARYIKTDGDIDAIYSTVQQWAADNPINNSSFAREMIDTDFLVQAGQASAANVSGGLSAAGSMNAQMRELSNQVAIATTTTPKMAQWYTELIKEDAPEFIARERAALVADMRQETDVILRSLMAFTDEQRVALTADLRAERTATLTTIHDDLLLLLAAAEKERIAVLERISKERLATLEQLNAITLAAIRQMVNESEPLTASIIDRIFWRIIHLLALPTLSLLIFIVVLLWMLRNALNRHFEYKETSIKE